jgi:putative DNA primase/helicase
MIDAEKIPQELRKVRRWVCWRYEEREGKKTKVPYNARSGKMASVTNWKDHSSFALVCNRAFGTPIPGFPKAPTTRSRNNYAGIGYVFDTGGLIDNQSPIYFTGIDLDYAIDDSGKLKPWAEEIIKKCPTYAEISPSGTGVHLISKGSLPEGCNGRKRAYQDGAVEIYSKGRYFTVTGDHIQASPATIEDQSAYILELYNKLGSSNGANRKSRSADDRNDHDDRLEVALKDPVFSRLWYGDISANNNDDSAADLALCNKIVFYFGPDPDLVDRFFRQSNLYREKWERDDYRKWTIDKAIEGTTERYRESRKTSKKAGATGQTESRSEPINDPGKEKSAELILDPANPLPTAKIFVERFYSVDGIRGLQHHCEVFYEYQRESNAYADVDESAVRSNLYAFLDSAKTKTDAGLIPFKPTKTKVENALDALRAVTNLPASSPAPSWLKPAKWDPFDVIACQNGLLHIPTRKLIPPTPSFFTLNGIRLQFNRTASKPEQWFKFLDQLWPDDNASIQCLQEWIGYLLTPRTLFQKIFMIVGPRRSGKGTIARVVRMLLGERSVCGPTLSNMAEEFGLAVLINKAAAIIADARISGRTDSAIITERLLSISGEDALSVPRKFLADWNGKLTARFMLLTNELPRIEDASGALASRFLILTLNESFYGREDHHLLERFIPELPGILLWALDGWDRLYSRGRFRTPPSTDELIQQFEDLLSPVGAFVRECCEIGKGFEVPVDKLFSAWKAWCLENGRERPGTVQVFGKELRASVPWLNMTRPEVCGVRIRYFTGLKLKP